MKPLLHLYQYIAPAVLAPISCYLWWLEYRNLPQILVAWLIPILWAYIVPAVGTNICKVWEFDVRWKLGRFRPHHGFVFGSATATIAWLIHDHPATNVADIFRFAIVLCSVLGFWNLLYEIRALRSGLLKVYNQPWADGYGAEAIALDYSPWFFGGFGFAHGAAIATFELLLSRDALKSIASLSAFIAIALAFCIALPVLGFIQYSLRTHGHAGTRPITKH